MTKEQLLEKIAAKFPGAKPGEETASVVPYPTVHVQAGDLLALATWLKNEAGFDYLDMVTAVDWLGPVSPAGFVQDPNPNPHLPEGAVPTVAASPKNPKVNYRDAFEVVYLFTSLQARLKLCLRVEVPRGDAKVPTLAGLFKAADWQEREVLDLLGITFTGHPNPVKILTPDFLEGHPLRKDYAHKKDRFD